MDFLLDFCRKAKAQGVNITIDTSGNPFTRREPFFSKFQELLNYVDLFLLDIKEINDETHRDLTGYSNENILDLARYLSEIGKPVWIRHVLVPEYSDKDEDLKKLDTFIRSLKNVERWKCCRTIPSACSNGRSWDWSIRWRELILRRKNGLQTPTSFFILRNIRSTWKKNKEKHTDGSHIHREQAESVIPCGTAAMRTHDTILIAAVFPIAGNWVPCDRKSQHLRDASEA